MKTIAFVTQKGGAGKTTLAASLAVAAIEAGETVVALDLDPQGSLAAWGNDRTAETPAVDQIDAERLAQLPRSSSSSPSKTTNFGERRPPAVSCAG